MKIKKTIILLTASLLAPSSMAGPAEIIENALDKVIKPGQPGCSVALVKQGKTWQVSKGLASIEYQVPLSSSSQMLTASTSKQFLGYGVMQLVHLGQLGLDQRLSQYLPQYKQYGEVTIAQLLNHSSGIRDHWETFEWSGKSLADHYTPEMVEDQLLNGAVNFTPNARYHYSNGGYFLLTKIIEKVSGQSFVDYMQQAVFKPLSMNNSFYLDDYTQVIKNRADGYLSDQDGKFMAMRNHSNIVGPGHIVTNLDDFTLWAKHLLSLDLETFYAPLLTYQMTQKGGKNNYQAGLIKQTLNGEPVYQHGGYYENWRQGFHLFVQQDMAIISLCNRSDFSTNGLNYSIAAKLLNWSEEKVKVDKLADQQNYTGIYYSQALNAFLDIQQHKNQLYYLGPTNSGYKKLSWSEQATGQYQGLGFKQVDRINFSQDALNLINPTLSGKFDKISLATNLPVKQLAKFTGLYQSVRGYSDISIVAVDSGLELTLGDIGPIHYQRTDSGLWFDVENQSVIRFSSGQASMQLQFSHKGIKNVLYSQIPKVKG
jgi:CubicO group peptidase (beta-lactamase class C family)